MLIRQECGGVIGDVCLDRPGNTLRAGVRSHISYAKYMNPTNFVWDVWDAEDVFSCMPTKEHSACHLTGSVNAFVNISPA